MKHLILTAGLIMTAIAVNPASAQVSDPLEPVNRAVFGFNNVVDTLVLDPAIVAYRAAVPKPVRSGLKNFLHNLKSPLFFANNVLQGDVDGAVTTLKRTTINTLVGFGGLFDFAAAEGIEADAEDFGQTLAVWGVDDGVYLVLPLLGPSNARDLTGLIVDSYADPLNRYADNVDEEEWTYARTAAKGLVAKNDIYDIQQDFKRNSSDYYAAVRSAAKQSRDAAIADRKKTSGADSQNAPLPDFE